MTRQIGPASRVTHLALSWAVVAQLTANATPALAAGQDDAANFPSLATSASIALTPRGPSSGGVAVAMPDGPRRSVGVNVGPDSRSMTWRISW